MDSLTGSLIFGGLNAGLGVLQGAATNAAERQRYADQVAFQDASNRFATWQAGFNARVSDANNQYRYWSETVNHNQSLAYVNSMRNVELLRSIRQAEVVERTRAAAGTAYVRDSEAINQAYSEASMSDAVALQQFNWRALQGRASVQAMATEGRSVDRIVNDYARQQGDRQTLQDINQKLRGRQYTREQAAQVAQYLTQWNSQTFYEEQQYLDPIAPFAPLPTLVQPAGPSMTGSAPSSAAAALNIGTGVLGGINSGISMYGTLKGLTIPSSRTGSGTGGNG
jgi:hypothetical protein